MTKFISDVAFTPTVKRLQETKGSRKGYARMEEKAGWKDTITEELAQFIGERDSFYLGTANADGQPYIQHRGGKPGFLKVIDDKTLAFADFGGNRQYISAGNLEDNDKAYLFLMDYPNRKRIKMWGTAKVVEDDPELMEKLVDPNYRGKPERAFVFTITLWDGNCPQHINPRHSEEEIQELPDCPCCEQKAGEKAGEEGEAPAAAETESPKAAATVTFTSEGVSAPLPPDEPILDVADLAGVDIDSSCRSGICGTCKVKLVSGSVTVQFVQIRSFSCDGTIDRAANRWALGLATVGSGNGDCSLRAAIHF